MNGVELIGSLLAVFSLGVVALFLLGLLQIHIANRQWANHRDRQYRDRTKATQHTTDNLPNGRGFGAVEKIIHNGGNN